MIESSVRRPPELDWSPPESFDEYRLLSLLGRGGMGEVYLGHDLLLDRPVAVKFIRTLQPNNDHLREQFLIEARAAARLHHPNVPTIYRVGEIDSHPYIVSEFIRGHSLDVEPKPMPWQRALQLGIGLSRALSAAHRHGVLHRDIKTGNAILNEDGQIMLLDFGLAKLLDAAGRERPNVQLMMSGEIPAMKTQTLAALPLAETQPLRPMTSAENASPGVNAAGAPIVSIKNTNGIPGGIALNARTREIILQIDSADFFSPVPIGHTSAGTIKGTPLYLAPEIWRGDSASRRSDIYSMGVLLYELCTGDPPYANVALPQLPLVVNRQPVPPLGPLVPDMDARFAAIVERCLHKDPAERYPDGEALRAALEALPEGGRSDAVPEGNPYRGLLPFEAEHRAVFFGRSNEVGTVIERLRSESLVLVAADSGVGKSSLCRAGVLPRIEAGALQGGRKWKTVTLLPGRQPLRALVLALTPFLQKEADSFMRKLREQPISLSRLLEHQLGADHGLVLFVDQLEELVTLSDPKEAEILALAIGSLGTRVGAVRLLATVRSDFLARVAALAGLGDELTRALYLLRPLSRDKLREAIVGPAKAKGVHFESDGLVETLIDTTVKTDGGLPLLQFALAELWDAHKDDAITAFALAAIGGVNGALARHADRVLLVLPPEQRVAARRILTALVTMEGTRARRREEELLVSPEAQPALEALVRGRLLIVRETETGGAIYEVAHEALIKGWTTLHRWLDEGAEGRAIKRSLETATADWLRLQRADDSLWGTRQLIQLDRFQIKLALAEQEFVAASKRQLRRSRLLRWLLVGAVPLLLLLLYGAVQLRTRSTLNKRVTLYALEGSAVLRHAQGKHDEAEIARRQALEAFDTQRAEIGEALWASAAHLEDEAEQDYISASQRLESSLALDTNRTDLRSLLADVLYKEALQADEERDPKLRNFMLQRMSLYDEQGERRRQFFAPGHVQLRTEPVGATVTVAQYVDVNGHRQLQNQRVIGQTPLDAVELEQGSYLFTFASPGRVLLRYPIVVGRDERLTVALDLPRAAEVPAGYVYVPPGRFLFGSPTDTTLRQSFLTTVPLHPVHTDAYLIAQDETTYGQWLDYLRQMSGAEQKVHFLHTGQDGSAGTLALVRHHGKWQLNLQPVNRAYQSVEGKPLHYDGRKDNADQDWKRLPVAGISYYDAREYVDWLDHSGRLPGARLCTDYEWERAARGADDREFPDGDVLLPTDANFDVTYDRDPLAMGPDAVGSHPGGRSPFGVNDMAGNVFEWTQSTLKTSESVARGGGFSFGDFTCRSSNRTVLDKSYRNPSVGLRVCASWNSHLTSSGISQSVRHHAKKVKNITPAT